MIIWSFYFYLPNDIFNTPRKTYHLTEFKYKYTDILIALRLMYDSFDK